MNSVQLQQEIRNTNLSFMQISRQMIRSDKAGAVEAFGMSEEMASLVGGLNDEQIGKLSASSLLLCSLHFDETMLLNLLGGYTKTPATAPAELLAA